LSYRGSTTLELYIQASDEQVAMFSATLALPKPEDYRGEGGNYRGLFKRSYFT